MIKCHPHVFLSVAYWLASRRGKKAKQTQHTQNLKKKKGGDATTFTKKHEVLDSNNGVNTREFFLFFNFVPVRI